MTDPEKLAELAARCEQASGPDHLFDAEIAKAVGWIEVLAFGYSWQGPHGQRHTDCPHYSGSLDAAMSLVPEGTKWAVYGGGWASVEAWEGDGDSEETAQEEGCVKAATPALALCAASLRSRMKVGG